MNKHKIERKFISYVASKTLEFDRIYVWFHLGLFFKDHALNFSNAIRRTLLTSTPGLVITEISFLGIQHELDSIPGIRETVFDIIENLKNIVFSSNINNLNFSKVTEAQGFIKKQGPSTVTAADIKISPNVSVVRPDQYIASLSWDAELLITFKLRMVDPNKIQQKKPAQQFLNGKKIFNIEQIPHPIKNVNYSIRKLDKMPEFEYIILDMITDGSIEPKQALQYSLYKITKLFYQFSLISFSSVKN
jgi:DNA-directed RNA polymerase subunit alpha